MSLFHSIMSLPVGKWGQLHKNSVSFWSFHALSAVKLCKNYHIKENIRLKTSVVTYSLVGVSFKIKRLGFLPYGFFNPLFTVSLICMKLTLITSNWNFKKPWTHRYPLSSPCLIQLVTLKVAGALFSCDCSVLLLTVTFSIVTGNSSSVYWSRLSLLLRIFFNFFF